MTDIEATAPCARGCTWGSLEEDEAPRPKPAKHGLLCNSCFYRMVAALELTPDLMGNMRANLWGIKPMATGDRVSGGGDGSPAPLRVGQLDASDALFAKLAGWVDVFSKEFRTTIWPPIRAWSNDREVQGSPPVSVEMATRQAAQMVGWLMVRLERISRTASAAAFHDDLCDGWEDSRGVFMLSAAYGVKARPTPPADRRDCPVCGHREVFLKLPDSFDPEFAVICGRCAWVADASFHIKHTSRWVKEHPEYA